jgi:hypothetical protein
MPQITNSPSLNRLRHNSQSVSLSTLSSVIAVQALRMSLAPVRLSARTGRDRAAECLGRDHDRAFVESRLAEIRQLLDDKKLRDRGVLAEQVSTLAAYGQQAATYDADARGGPLRSTSRS